jgi:Bacteriophage probable baseplate hub protein
MTATSFVSVPVLTVGGTTNTDAGGNLVALTVEETIVGLYRCEARLANYGYRNDVPDYLYLGRDVFDFGTTLAVTFGPATASRQVFAGKISAIQADYPSGEQAQVLVFAEDGLQALRLTRRTRTFEDSSTADIARKLAGEHGLTPSIDLDGPTRKVVAQLNQSDLALLREQARRDDGEVWLDGTTLHVSRRPDRDGGSVDLSYGADLLSFSVRADLADQCTEQDVTGWDVAAKDAIAESATSSALGAELAGGDTCGGDALRKAFGERTERLVRGTPLTSDDARALAKAMYLQRARRFVCGTGLTGGTPALRVGATVNLKGLGALFNGAYYVSRTRHMFDLVLGYRTEFDVERAGIGAAS